MGWVGSERETWEVGVRGKVVERMVRRRDDLPLPTGPITATRVFLEREREMSWRVNVVAGVGVGVGIVVVVVVGVGVSVSSA